MEERTEFYKSSHFTDKYFLRLWFCWTDLQCPEEMSECHLETCGIDLYLHHDSEDLWPEGFNDEYAAPSMPKIEEKYIPRTENLTERAVRSRKQSYNKLNSPSSLPTPMPYYSSAQIWQGKRNSCIKMSSNKKEINTKQQKVRRVRSCGEKGGECGKSRWRIYMSRRVSVENRVWTNSSTEIQKHDR